MYDQYKRNFSVSQNIILKKQRTTEEEEELAQRTEQAIERDIDIRLFGVNNRIVS